MVRDVLKIKLKFTNARVKETRKEYDEEMRKTERVIEKGTRRWNKMRRRLQSYTNKWWEELRLKYEEKLKHLVKKYRKEETAKVTTQDKDEEEMIDGIALSDDDLERMEESKKEILVAMFGDFEQELNEDELTILKLSPKFAVFDKLCILAFRESLAAAMTKIRWERRRNGTGEDEEEEKPDKDAKGAQEVIEKELTDEEARDLEMIELKTREIFNLEEMDFDMRKRMATDVKTNQRVIMPDARPANEEAELLVRCSRLEGVFKKYMESNCDEKGNLLEGNLTQQEKRGLKKLLKRVKETQLKQT